MKTTESKKKKYGVVFDLDVFESLDEAVKKSVAKGGSIKYRIFELGQEYQVILREPEVKEI